MMAGLACATGALRPVIALLGPTGTGKSSWALELAAQLPLEIVSVDSAQVYRGLDIGTAKPATAERARVPHHLIDLRDPAASYSAGDFARDATAAIDAIHARGRIPLLVGGTLLYLRALYQGLAALPPADAGVRAQLDAEAARSGWPSLHARLHAVDPQAAARIHPNDPQRIQRALEVHALTGRSISSLQSDTHGARERYRWLRHALWPADRAAHGEWLAARFDAMLGAGLCEEIRALHARGDLHAALPSIRSVGYRQMWAWCEGRASLEDARRAAIVATRQLCKRQMTWLRSETSKDDWVAGDPAHFQSLRKNIGQQLERNAPSAV